MIKDLALKMYIGMKNLPRKKKGQGMVEYVLIISLVAMICITIFFQLGGKIHDAIQKIIDGITTGTSNSGSTVTH